MSVTFTYAASDGDVTCIGIPCRCPVDEFDADPCEHKRHELNVCNGNAEMLLRALGIPFDYSGTVDPLTVLSALTRPAARNVSRYYLTKLRDLAADAVQRHVMIGWA